MKLQLTRKTFAIFGYKAGGKSTLAQYIASKYGETCLYYDTLHEVPDSVNFFSYSPVARQSLAELLGIIKIIQTSRHYRLFIIDEANRFARAKPAVLPQELADMNDWCRHPQYNLGIGYIARRPVQLNQDLTELCDYLFVFQLGGKNDIQYLNSLRQGLGDVVLNLPLYHYCLVYPDRKWKVFSPIKPIKI